MSSSTAAPWRQRASVTVAALVMASAALVVVGIFLERHAESGTQHSVGSTTAEHHENHQEKSAEESHIDTAPPASESGSEVAEHHTGIGVESPRIVALGTVAAIALAVAVWRRPSRPVLVAVLVFTAAAAVLDVLEIKHQVGEGRVGLALLAAFIVALRVATIGGCGYLYRAGTQQA